MRLMNLVTFVKSVNTYYVIIPVNTNKYTFKTTLLQLPVAILYMRRVEKMNPLGLLELNNIIYENIMIMFNILFSYIKLSTNREYISSKNLYFEDV